MNGDRPSSPLHVAEVKAMLGQCDPGTLIGKRNQALICVMWRAGLRCSEALQLALPDVEVFGEPYLVRVLHGKGRKQRVVGLDGQAAAVIAEWGAARRTRLPPGPLFCAVKEHPGAPLSSRYVRMLVGQLGVRAGLERRVHPHALRHSYACDLHRQGWSVVQISHALGHSNIGVTDVYLSHLMPMQEVMLAQDRGWD